jgi:hypothetical protein
MTRTNDDFQTPSQARIEQSMKRAHELRSAAFANAFRSLFSWTGRDETPMGAFAPAE